MTQRWHGWHCALALASIGLVASLTITGFGRNPAVALTQCQYLVKRANDGDSFNVSVSGKEYIFRLYFVDTPETTTEFRNRVKQQATYFKVSEDQSLRLGELAKQ